MNAEHNFRTKLCALQKKNNSQQLLHSSFLMTYEMIP